MYVRLAGQQLVQATSHVHVGLFSGLGSVFLDSNKNDSDVNENAMILMIAIIIVVIVILLTTLLMILLLQYLLLLLLLLLLMMKTDDCFCRLQEFITDFVQNAFLGQVHQRVSQSIDAATRGG